MTKGFTMEGGMRFAFPPYALISGSIVSALLEISFSMA
jgi:hypothetical protein